MCSPLTSSSLLLLVPVECVRLEREQVGRARTRALQTRFYLGQEALVIEACGGELGCVERAGRRPLLESNLCHASPEVGEHQVPHRSEVVDGCGAYLVSVGQRAHSDAR